ncbi:hypothetical protein QAD02_008735 [Eretmocerus hayati]|uniref:Uncharacterized protein n=1 Tax=Eretmocerus hayati TaxID=131215 RepID=A0ACC2N7F3_9HYME|nr:hypothetical protein QAD02_008735 [Eretmocerus hayati]
MDCTKWTPSKNKIDCDSVLMLSPITKTPIRQTVRLKTSFQSNTSSFSVLPNHITPPSGLTKFMARNPFEADLTNKLHISVISPTVFSKGVSPSHKSSPGFTWSIDEIALIQPAKIDEYPTQQMHCSDPEMERNAQEAISRFFSENQIIPSPYENKKSECDAVTPTQCHEDTNLSRESYKSRKDKRENSAQTTLSLPPVLPPSLEEALKPYFNFTQDQNCENEEANSSNSSLRRKLFSNHEDSHDDSTNSLSISPVQSNSPLIHNLSPPQSGMFFHGTPLRNGSQITQRTFGTPLASTRDSPPYNVSPISNPAFNMSCQSIRSRNKSVIKLDFTRDMSIEMATDSVDDQLSPEAQNICKTLFSDEIKMMSDKDTSQFHMEEDHNCDVTQMFVSTGSARSNSKNKENHVPIRDSVSQLKFTEAVKGNFSDSYAMQQSNMLSGNYVQQNVFTSAQDTGYQTNNSCSITSNMDSHTNSIRQKLHWDEKITHTDDEVHLVDWRDNMTNMISSTPSKYNKGLNDF